MVTVVVQVPIGYRMYDQQTFIQSQDTVPVFVGDTVIASLTVGEPQEFSTSGKVMPGDLTICGHTWHCAEKIMYDNFAAGVFAPETWLFNETIDTSGTQRLFNTTFVAGGREGYYFAINYIEPNSLACIFEDTGQLEVLYNANNTPKWTNEAYRTVALLEPASGSLLTYMQANATKL